jgi:hypothetical protein
MKKYRNWILLTCLAALLCACQTWQTPDNIQKARCKEMKNRIVLSGGRTANKNLAFQERSDRGKLEESYDNEGC